MSPASESKKYKLHGKILFGWPKKKPKKKLTTLVPMSAFSRGQKINSHNVQQVKNSSPGGLQHGAYEVHATQSDDIQRDRERLLLTIYMLFRGNSVRYKRTHLYKCNIYFSARGRTAMQATV